MKFHLKYTLFCIGCCSTLISCIEEQDFGQFDDLRVTPTAEASILYIEASETKINAAGDAAIISRNFNFDAFSSDIFAKRVLDGAITYIVENTTTKTVKIFVELLNEDGDTIDVEEIETSPGLNTRVVAYGSSGKDINIIRFTSSIRITAVNIGNSTSTSDLPDPKIILKSSGKFRLKIK